MTTEEAIYQETHETCDRTGNTRAIPCSALPLSRLRLISEARRMARVRIAAEAYQLDPLNADDRPSSWRLHDALMDAIIDAGDGEEEDGEE